MSCLTGVGHENLLAASYDLLPLLVGLDQAVEEDGESRIVQAFSPGHLSLQLANKLQPVIVLDHGRDNRLIRGLLVHVVKQVVDIGSELVEVAIVGAGALEGGKDGVVSCLIDDIGCKFKPQARRRNEGNKVRLLS